MDGMGGFTVREPGFHTGGRPRAGDREITSQDTRSALNFTARMRSLCEHVVGTLDEFQHIDLSRVVVSFAQTRKPVLHGLQAFLVLRARR